MTPAPHRVRSRAAGDMERELDEQLDHIRSAGAEEELVRLFLDDQQARLGPWGAKTVRVRRNDC